MYPIKRNDPIAFFRTAKKAVGIMSETMKEGSDREKKKAWDEKMYQDRWKNLAFSTVFSLVLGVALYLEITFGLKIFGPITGWIMIIVTGAITLLTVYTVISYIKMIIAAPRS